MEGLVVCVSTMSLEACSNVMQTALDAGYTYGIGYWAELVEEEKKDNSGRVRSMQLRCREGEKFSPELLEAVNINNAVATITDRAIKAAVNKMLCDPNGSECGGITMARLLDDDLDGPLADVIIQVACFGKVVFG